MPIVSRRAYKTWTGVALNEMLHERDAVAARLRQIGIYPRSFAEHDSESLRMYLKRPDFNVVVIGLAVGIVPIRDVLYYERPAIAIDDDLVAMVRLGS